MPSPTILISPGAFTPAPQYTALATHLRTHDLPVHTQTHPSSRRIPGETPSTLAEDAAFLNGMASLLCDQGQDVVVLSHSYGGVVATAAVKGLTEKYEGKGRVVGLVYLTAGAPKVGESPAGMMKGLSMDHIQADGDFMFYGSLEGAAQACFSDLPLEEGIEYARQSVYQSAVSFAREYQYAGYADVDNVAYILCTEDKALPPGTQEQMISIINASRPAKSRAAVYKLATSHSPHVSAPEKLAELVVEAIRKFQ